MAYFSGTIYSSVLNLDTALHVILPTDSRPHLQGGVSLKNGITPRERPRTLILLHGYSDCASTWVRRTSIERYAEQYDIAVVMPEVYKSAYADMKYGDNYFTYIVDELPQLCEKLFNVSTAPEDLYIAGLSMGGFGTLKAVLTHPERFAAGGAFSPGVDFFGGHPFLPIEEMTPEMRAIATQTTGGKDMNVILKAAYGDPMERLDSDDLWYLSDHLGERAKNVTLYHCCGRQDFLYPGNLDLKKQLEHAGLGSYTYEEWDGIHEWGFWDLAVQKFLALYVK